MKRFISEDNTQLGLESVLRNRASNGREAAFGSASATIQRDLRHGDDAVPKE
jgi:hypothetical protein